MLPRPEPTEKPAVSHFFNQTQSLNPNKLSGQDSSPIVEDEAILQVDDDEAKERLKREAERQAIFNKASNDRLGIPNGYRKVEVLLIRWDESIDEFKAHGEEIERLEKIFTTGFNYGCTVAKLRNNRNPQLELNHAVSQHVMEHDGEENLLIVYYTGHGGRFLDDKGLHLRLSAMEYIDKKSVRPPTAFWEKAEEPLRTLTSADVLAILDCCFASTAAVKGNSDQTRAYYLLAASSTEGVTNEPGPKSFTTALCDSLEELLEESKGDTFPLIKLWERINTKPQQGSIPWDRLERHKQTFGNIELGRLEPGPQRDESFRKAQPELASLTLRFSLKTPCMNDNQIKTLARSLPVAFKEAQVPVRRMEWVKFEQREDYLIRKVAKRFQQSLLGTKRKRSPSRAGDRIVPPETRSQTRSNELLLLPPESRAREGSATSEEAAASGLCTPPRRRGRDRRAAEEKGA